MSNPAEHSDGFDRAIELAARELARAAVSTHPQPEELVAYQEGRLAEDDAARVRRHLLVCSECAEELDQLAHFDQEPDDELLPTPAETAADWAAFQEILAVEEAEPAADTETGLQLPPPAPQGAMQPIAETPPVRFPTPRRSPRESWLLAASVILAVSGLGFWIAGLGGRAAAPTPEPATLGENPWLVALVPDGEDLRRDAGDGGGITLPADVDLLILRLHLGDQTPYPTYRADLFDAAGVKSSIRPRLRRQPAGYFLALIDRTPLAAGRYRLELVAVSDGEERTLATYSFELRDPPSE